MDISDVGLSLPGKAHRELHWRGSDRSAIRCARATALATGQTFGEPGASVVLADRRKEAVHAAARLPRTINTPMVQSLAGGNATAVAEFLRDEPIGRIAEPDEVAAAVLWLCSARASSVVGHALLVDGGYTAH